ncbi:MAG TPA: hypothetical protein VGA20_09885 [Gemmatimonadales bacterium]
MNRAVPLALLAAVAGCAIPPLRSAEPVTGRLTIGHPQFEDGSHFQQFQVDLRRGDTLTALLTSDDFDALLLLEDWYGVKLTENDDGGGDCNARLAYVAPYASLYRLYVTSTSGGELGAFRLQIWKSAPPPPPSETPCGDFGDVAGTVLLGQTVMGHVRASSLERWTLAVAPGTRFTVDIASDEFDPRVVVVRGRGDEVAADDDSGPGCGARVTYTAPDARPLRIVVSPSPAAPGQSGGYFLSVRPGARPLDRALDCQLGVPVDPARISRRIRVGDRAPGMLSRRDTRLPGDGTMAQWWRLEGAAVGDSVTIDLVSDAFDAYLVVTGPGIEGGALEDDDSGGACHARISLRLTGRGDYHIIVNTTVADATGPFLLRVSAAPPPPAPGACPQD